MKLTIRLKPRSSKNELIKKADNTYVAFVTAPAVKGMANMALIKLLASTFGVAKSSVKIVKGVSSRNKIISIGE